MSVFGKLFGGGSKGGKGPSPQDAIQRLRETEEMLTKKQEFLEKKIEQELVTAKKNGTKNKRGKLDFIYPYWLLLMEYNIFKQSSLLKIMKCICLITGIRI